MKTRLWESPSLGDIELLACVLGRPPRGLSAVAVADRLLRDVGGLGRLMKMDPGELARRRDVGPARAERVLAALALGRRALSDTPAAAQVLDPAAAERELGPGLRGLAHEELHALYLDRRRVRVAHRMLTRGSDAFTVVDPKQVYKPAVALGACAVILAHNHPSGDPEPSPQDLQVTQAVARAGATLGVPLLDHLIIAGQHTTSLAERGQLPRW